MNGVPSAGGWARLLGPFAPGEALENEPLEAWTTVRVGGPAELFVRPGSTDRLVELLRRVREEGAPMYVLGGGANTLVADDGLPGLTIKLPPEVGREERVAGAMETRITLSAGAPVGRLVGLMKTLGLVGAEFLAGVPGTVGGAVAMNAGTPRGECLSVVEAIELATASGVGWVARSALTVGYRYTKLPPGGVVTRVRFVLRAGDAEESSRAMEADLAHRKRTQPLSWPTFGSVFRNPPGDFAGRLIEAAGLKGHVVGGAQISPLHANWIVNLGGAKAQEIRALIELAFERVREKFGIELVPEVKCVGKWAP